MTIETGRRVHRRNQSYTFSHQNSQQEFLATHDFLPSRDFMRALKIKKKTKAGDSKGSNQKEIVELKCTGKG